MGGAITTLNVAGRGAGEEGGRTITEPPAAGTSTLTEGPVATITGRQAVTLIGASEGERMGECEVCMWLEGGRGVAFPMHFTKRGPPPV